MALRGPSGGDDSKALPTGIAPGPRGNRTVRIQSVEPIVLAAPEGEASSPWSSTVLFVRMTTADGSIGWGQAPTTLMTLPVRESVREVARVYEGTEVEDLAGSFERFCRFSFYHSRSIEATAALSAVDIACHDLLGRRFGVPIHRLLGGPVRSKLAAYANGWYADCIEPEEFAARAKAITAQGYRAIKFDPFHDAYGTISDAEVCAASDRVQAVRAAVGRAVDLLIEFHGRFLPEHAVRAAQALDVWEPRFMEEPVHPELCDALSEFRTKVRAPVALGERLTTPADFASFLRRGLVDILQPDITNSGGFTSGRKIAGIAESFGAPLAYHNAFGPVQTAATLQLDATLPTFFIQESFEASWPPWKRSLVKGYRWENGAFEVPDRPGLGVEVVEKAVEEFRSEAMEPVGGEPPWVVGGTWLPRNRSPKRAQRRR
jgi:gluconate/galactonate dehydratase